MRKSYKALIILPLLCCVFLCIFYRDLNTNSNILLAFFFEDFYVSTKSIIQESLQIPNFVIYILPTALWLFSITLLGTDLHLKIKNILIPFHFLPLSYLILLEILQLLSVTNGTFDIWDILVPMMGWILAILLLRASFFKRPIQISMARKIAFFFVFGIIYMADTYFRL